MKRFELFFGIIKIPIDFLMTVLAFLAAYKLRILTESLEGFAKPIDYSVLPTTTEYLNFSIAAAGALVLIFAFRKMYNLKSTFKFSQETKKTIFNWGIWAMLIITYFFFTRTFPFSRLATLYSWTLTLIFILIGRAIIRGIQLFMLRHKIGKRRLLFIGDNKITIEIKDLLSKNPSYEILDQISLKNIDNLEHFLKNKKIDEVIQTESSKEKNTDENILEICDLNHINYRFVPDLLEVRKSNILTETIGNFPIIAIKPTPLEGWGSVNKRILDIIGSLLGLIVFSPIFLITAIAIKINSRGPILFTKLDDGSSVKRVGLHGKFFKFYKFRSMYPNTDHLRYTKLANENLRKDGPLVKIKDDPRVTKVGKFIRKFSIDELPQLWNVFIGNMSLVGPRAHLPEEVAKYEKHHRFVFTIKPGVTGLAQINGRSDLNFEEEAKLDRYYIENWSIFMDLKIILKTLGVVLKGYQE